MQETNDTSNITLDFEQAKAKHLLFKSKLRSILYGAKLTDEAPVLSHFECTVGKWIYNHALKAYGHIPEMQELEKVHADIHTSARELVRLYKDGKEEDARKGLIGMEKIADHLVGLLAIVEHKLTIIPPKINVQYEGLENSRAELNDLLKANEHLDKRIQEQSGKLITERMVLYNSFMNAPAGIAILKDNTLVYEFANAEYEKLRGRKITIGKTVEELFPEIEQQALIGIFKNVFSTGEPFITNELPVEINTKGDGILEKLFLNLVVQPLKDEKGNTERLLAHIINVTEQVTTRKKIEESEEQLRIAIEGGDLGTYDYYPQTGELMWSAKTKELFGLPPDAEVNYDTFLKGLHPDDKERVYAANQKALKKESGGIYDNEYRTMGITDGKVRWVKSKGITSFDKDDKPIRFTGVTQDITEEEAAKEAVAYRNALLEAQNEAIPDAILIVDTKGKMISFNQHFVELWKIPAEIIERKDDAAALQYAMTQLINPQDFIDRVNYYYANPDEKSNEEVLFKDGRIIKRYGNAVIGEDGTRYGWAWYFRDITTSRKNEIEIKQSEVRFRTLANSVSHLAWMANPDGWIYWYNQRWYDYSDTTLEEMQGWGWEKVHHPDHIERVINFVKDAWQKGEPYELTFPLKRSDGAFRWFLTRVYPVKNNEGNVIQWIGTNTDIDDQKKALEQKDEFLSVASHELKTPVTSIKGYTQILQHQFEKEGNAQAVNLLTRMNKQVDKLTKLIVDLLDVTKIENGQLAFSEDEFDFTVLINEMVEEMQLTTKSHKIINEVSDTSVVTGDRNRIGQVITNLISNAIKYSPDAHKIIVSTSKENQHIKFRVKDFGIGIPNEKKSNIFNRFYRVSGDKENTFPGLGLGLFISKEIIKRHNGEIFAESSEEKGSTFCFTLPLKKE